MSKTPTLPTNGFTLIDSARRSKDHPDTWAHPDQGALDEIQPGYFVKVGLTHTELIGERFWGRVRGRSGANIEIEVDQDMRYSDQHGVSDQDVMVVQEQNVFGIVNSRGEPVWEAG